VRARNRFPLRLLRPLCLTLALTGCAQAAGPALPAPRTSLAAVLDSITSTPPLNRTHWGVMVHDPAAGTTTLSLNADRHFIPASNTKLVVATVALGELGPAYRYETKLWAANSVSDSVVGELMLVATGDPTMSSRFLPDDFAALDSIAAGAAATGLRRVTGDLVIDASAFDEERVHATWEIGDLPFGYAAPVGAFAIGEGTFSIVRAPGDSVGAPARITVVGGAHLQPVAANVTTDTAGAPTRWQVDYIARGDSIRITGSLALDAAPDTVRLAVTDPVAYASRAFSHALQRRGIVVEGALRIVHDSAHAAALRSRAESGLHVVATYNSPAMADIVAAILQPSQNWIAEQVLKTLGALRRGRGTWATGLAIERRYLIERVGLDSLAFSLRDASGLSAQNLLTPRSIVQILQHARNAAWGGEFRRALAAPGLRGSTLATRLQGLEGRVQAKTGTITNVNSLSGFITADDGRELIFSIMTNGSGLPSATVRAAIDRLVLAIARQGEVR